jgi:Cu-Zn family superoxide dismutase
MRQHHLSWRIIGLALLLALGIVAPTQAQQMPGNQRTQVFAFPEADTIFPEGVAKDPNSNFFYVGSTANGAVYRGDVRQPNRGLSVFLPGGADGRTTAIGMKVDGQGCTRAV